MTVSKCIPLKQSFFSCSIGRDVGGATFDGRESCLSSAREELNFVLKIEYVAQRFANSALKVWKLVLKKAPSAPRLDNLAHTMLPLLQQ